MAYYPPEFVERIRLIKQLQEQRFMPLKVIKRMMDEDPERTRALIELEDRVSSARWPARRSASRPPSSTAATTSRATRSSRLVELGVLTPNSRGYSQTDVKIVEAICRFRAGGYDERIGFTVYDTLRYKSALEGLVKEEVEVLLERLAGEMDADRAVELIEAGVEPLQDLISALHSKLLVAELQRQKP